MRWAVVVPVKRLSQAKSRLSGPEGADRVELALAFATDTVAAVQAVPVVEVVVVVTADDAVRRALTDGVVVVDDPPGAGLDEALAAGAATARSSAPEAGVAGLVADLPALRSEDLAAALESATAHPRSVVTDASGSGTTMLAVLAGQLWTSSFGQGSAGRHLAAGAVALPGALESLRRDVDTESDLAAAQALGVGAATAEALDRLASGRSHDVQATVRDFDGTTGTGSAVTDAGLVVEIPAGSVVDARLLRCGQRVVVHLVGGDTRRVSLFGAPPTPPTP